MVLLGQSLPDVVLGHGAALEQQGADPPAGKALDGQSAIYTFLGQRTRADEKDAESRHGLRHYRVTAGRSRRP